jgi:uncharacterized membrane-anchored protein
MNKGLLLKIVFVPVMLLYIGVPVFMITRYEGVLDQGKLYRFYQVRPVDPHDFFRGQYVTLNFREDNIDQPGASEEFERGGTAYIALTTDSLGFAKVKRAFSSPPEGEDYFEAEVKYVYDDRLMVRFPFERYYMNEKMAPLAEQEYNTRMRDRNDSVFIDVRVFEGKAVLENVLINRIPLREYLKIPEQRVDKEE